MADNDIIGEITTTDIDGDIDTPNLEGDIVSPADIDGEVGSDEVEGDVEALPYEVDPTVPSWAKQENKPDYVYQEIGDKPSVNGVMLYQDKSIEDLGVKTMTNQEILDIFNRVIGGN